MNNQWIVFFLFGYQVIITPWKIIGLMGVSLFTARWLVQVYYSHRAGRPITPRAFWILSVVGSLMALAYFVFSSKQDMVGILGYLFPSIVAIYNLYLDLTYSKKKQAPDFSRASKSADENRATTIDIST